MERDTLDKTHTSHNTTDNGSWEGAAYPFKVGYGKLMIWPSHLKERGHERKVDA